MLIATARPVAGEREERERREKEGGERKKRRGGRSRTKVGDFPFWDIQTNRPGGHLTYKPPYLDYAVHNVYADMDAYTHLPSRPAEGLSFIRQ